MMAAEEVKKEKKEAIGGAGMKEVKVVVAIDFGTCRSGYGFASVKQPTQIICEQKWPNRIPSLKTRTDVLLRPDLSLVCFGDAALRDYLEMDAKGRKEFLFFSGFKMCLYGTFKERPVVKAANGKLVSAQVVFSRCLAFFKMHALERLKESTKGLIAFEDVLWVLTVPAIWSPAAKEVMREAAHEGLELKTITDQQRLVLALEPEAASLCCRAREALVNPAEFKTGSKWIVLDCGGGTVDTTVHELSENGSLKEICAASGGDWGVLKVDAAFVALLGTIFGAEVMEQFKDLYGAEYAEMMADFDALKQTVAPTDVRPRRLRIPISFLTHLQQVTVGKKTVEHFVNRYNNGDEGREKEKEKDKQEKKEEKKEEKEAEGDDEPDEWVQVFVGSEEKSKPKDKGETSQEGAKKVEDWPEKELAVTYARGQLKFSHDVIMGLFTPTVSKITKHLEELLIRVPDVSHVFLVGGFADSAVLREATETTVTKLTMTKAKVVSPPHPSIAVITGAVMFGLNQRAISSRILPKTYGIYVAAPANDPRLHPERTRQYFLQNGRPKPYIMGGFETLVKAGTQVDLDQGHTTIFTPLEDGQRAMCIRLFESPLTKVSFVDEAGCQEVAAFRVEMAPGFGSGLNRSIATSIKFGATEITVSAKEVETGQVMSATISFLDQHYSTKNGVVRYH